MAKRRTRALARALLHPVRATLKKRIAAAGKPLAIETLATTTDLDLRFVRYHVGILAACGAVKVAPDGRVA
jgi:hypothetical protein